MRLQLETTPAELADKGEDLIKALVGALRPVDGELAERLEKALPPEEPALKHPALRGIHARMRDAYRAQVDRMVREIGQVLQRSVAGRGEGVAKSLEPAPVAELRAAIADAVDALEKAAQHKYIRRIPTGKPRPRYRYIYRESAAAAAPGDHKTGEKVRIKSGDKEGHYEVTAVHPGGWVTLKHDETGHEVTAKQEWLKELFLQEYADKHAADRKRLAETYQKAKEHGSEKQKEFARKRLADHMARFPDPTARAAELVAEHAKDQAEGSKDPHAHLAAAQAQVDALAVGARGGKERIAEAKTHIEHAAKLVVSRKRGTGKPKAPGDFGSKAWSYAAITEAIEESADFSAADAAYKRWKGEADRGGPKPPAWEGGELDAVNEYLERKVSSPREAWDRLTVGVKKWSDPRVAEALELMREIPGYAGIRLPDDVIDWITTQVEGDWGEAAEAEYYAGQGEEHPEEFPEDAFDFPFGALAKALLEYADLLKAGPFIGPRGGKWADPQHKIPWTEEGAEKKHVSMQLKVHPKIGGGGEHTIHVAHAGGGMVHVSTHGPGQWGPKMPAESLKHFLNDLAGKVEGPKTDHKHIAPVLEGKAEFLGKGDDGLAFKVGDKVVKVSTTVPYQPENPGHRTPEQAKDMLRKQVEVGNMLADKGIEGVQRSTFVEHGDKGFQIKPYVEIPEKFTREQLDAIQDTLIEIHKAGYSVNDAIQAGLQDGKPVMFDVGKADKIPEKDDRKGVYSVVTGDMEAMARLYQESGEVFVRRDFSQGQQRLQDVLAKWDKWLNIGNGKFAHRHLTGALEMRAKELKATLKGKELDDALDDLDSSVWAERVELEEKLGLIVPTYGPAEGDETSKSLIKSGGPYIGPRGGKWADPQHTIPWEEPGEKAPRKRAKHLFHTTGYHRMEQIKEHGLQPREGAGTFEGGGYAGHSQGKVFLAANFGAANEWAEKVQQQLEDQSDKTHERIPVMLRVVHRATKKDEVGERDIEGSRYVKEGIPPEDLEFYHPKKGWLPVAQWGDDTGTEHGVKETDEHGAYIHSAGEGGYTPTSAKHAGKHSEATAKHRAELEQKRAAKEREQERERSEAAAKVAVKREAEEGERAKVLAEAQAEYAGEKRKAKIAELLAEKRKSPIPGQTISGLLTMTEYKGQRLPWREVLQVTKTGEDLAKAEELVPVADDFEDMTKPIADKDGADYKRIKMHLIRRGYELADFERGGALYGYSVNALLDLARERNDN